MLKNNLRLLMLSSTSLAVLMGISLFSPLMRFSSATVIQVKVPQRTREQSVSVQFPQIPEGDSLRELLRRIFPDDEVSDPPTTSRGDFCLLAPARLGESTVIWNENPVLIWQGSFGKIEIVDKATNKVMWTYQPTTSEETYVRYGGEPLSSGINYAVNIYQAENSPSPYSFPAFSLLPVANRHLIANGLAVVAQTSLNSNLPIEVLHAHYFKNRGLSVDAIQSLFSTDNPDIELMEAREEVVQSICNAN